MNGSHRTEFVFNMIQVLLDDGYVREFYGTIRRVGRFIRIVETETCEMVMIPVHQVVEVTQDQTVIYRDYEKFKSSYDTKQ